METNQNLEQTQKDNNTVEDAKVFIKTKLLTVVKKILKEPISGSYEVFNTADKNKQTNALSLLGVGFVATLILLYLTTPSSMRSYIDFSYFFKASLSVTIALFLISLFTFIIKSINGVKISFGEELLTAGICAIPTTIFLILVFLSALLLGSNFNPLNGPSEIYNSGGILIIIIIIYLFLYYISIIQQSLKASKINDALSWYISPIILATAYYATFKIAVQLFS